MNFPAPTPDYVCKQLAAFDANPNYYGAEQAVGMVFGQWPLNTSYDEIVVKVTVLNRMYSTNIYDVWTTADHIHKLNIDDRLARGDISVVPDIAKIAFRTRTINCYSFATKYCSWHQPDHYQIYDGYVDWIVWKYKKQHDYAKFYRYEMLEYPRFIGVIDALRDHFGLTAFSRKEIDKFLWIEGVTQWRAQEESTPKGE